MGLISTNLTGTPELATCQAASLPARPAPIIAALAWVVFNIQKPAREQFNRDFLGKD